jgi:hypothetical protein
MVEGDTTAFVEVVSSVAVGTEGSPVGIKTERIFRVRACTWEGEPTQSAADEVHRGAFRTLEWYAKWLGLTVAN